MSISDETGDFTQLRKGLLEFAILQVVSLEAVYVADILTRLSPTVFATSEGTLYPLLSRLKREGLLAYDWVESESGPPRKYYRLTKEGTTRLTQLRMYWQELQNNLDELGGAS